MRRRLLIAVLGLAGVLAGCGLGPGSASTGGASLTVSQDFGALPVGAARTDKIPGSETVMRFLQRRFKVSTTNGGGFVQSINGTAGGTKAGHPVDWFYYVNGIEAPKGAAATDLHPGDRVLWDHHDWSQTMRIPAIVGAYPEPFLDGIGGHRYPVRIDCTRSSESACDAVNDKLRAAGVKGMGRAAIRQSAGREVMRLVVGTINEVAADTVAATIGDGPKASGVYVKWSQDGKTLTVLDPDGKPARTLGPGTGLIAATRYEDQQPTWVVTGTDQAGLKAAVDALDEGELGGKFAIAIAGGEAIRAPFVGEAKP